MQAGGVDIAGGRVDADHLGAEPGKRLAEDAAAAADLNERKSGKRLARADIAPAAVRRWKVACELVSDESDADRIELVQGPHGPVRVPPIGAEPFEFFDIGFVHRGTSRFHISSPSSFGEHHRPGYSSIGPRASMAAAQRRGQQSLI